MGALWSRWTDDEIMLHKWADVGLAQAWLERARDLSTPAVMAQWDGQPYREQIRTVNEAWTALGNAFRALDCPPLSHPEYRRVMGRWYGEMRADDGAESRAMIRALTKAVGLGTERGPQGEATRRFLTWWTAARKPAIDANSQVCNVVVRAMLAHPASTPAMFCYTGLGAEGDGTCDFHTGFLRFIGCANFADRESPCEQYHWRTLAFESPPQLAPAAGPVCRVSRVLPPLRWSLEICQEIATAMLARGARQTMVDSFLWVSLANMKELQRLDDGRTPRALIEAANRVPADILKAQYGPNLTRDIGVQFARTLAAGMALVPGGQAFALVFLLLGEILRTMPLAVGVETDEFGLARPIRYEKDIPKEMGGSGGKEDAGPPTHEIPDPPGFNRAAATQRAASGAAVVAGPAPRINVGAAYAGSTLRDASRAVAAPRVTTATHPADTGQGAGNAPPPGTKKGSAAPVVVGLGALWYLLGA